jgi:glutaredoxin
MVASQLRTMSMAQERSATLYRMVLPDHECPFGVRAKQMLERSGFEIDEHVLGSRDEVDAFKAEQGVATTPQVFIDGERIGGSDDLERYLAEATTN